MIRRAKLSEIGKILKITAACAEKMAAEEIFQWNEHYPNEEAFFNDINRKELFVLEIENIIIGCIVISTHKDVEYETVAWLTTDVCNYYIHRLAIHPEFQKKGYAKELMDYAEALALKNNISSIRLDTFSKNLRNQKFYEARKYTRLQSIFFPKQSIYPFFCYEKLM